jgi:hypothetical protein
MCRTCEEALYYKNGSYGTLIEIKKINGGLLSKQPCAYERVFLMVLIGWKEWKWVENY